MIKRDEFDCLMMVNELDLNKPAKFQNEIKLSYRHQDQITSLCHGIITIFKVPKLGYFVLGIPQINTDQSTHNQQELQCCVGDQLALEREECTLTESLRKLIEKETYSIFSLGEFTISSFYAIHRVAEWNLCYLKIISIFNRPISLYELKTKVALINQARCSHNASYFGIYNLEQVIPIAIKTENLHEGSKPKTNILNYSNNKYESFVILDDRVIAMVFSQFSVFNLYQLFPTLKNTRLSCASDTLLANHLISKHCDSDLNYGFKISKL